VCSAEFADRQKHGQTSSEKQPKKMVFYFSRRVFAAAVFYEAAGKAYKEEVATSLSSVHRPTQVIWGADDQVTGQLHLRLILTLIALRAENN